MRGIIYVVLIAVLVLSSMAATFYELSRAGDLPSIRQFELVHNFPTDYNFYLSRIRQGLEGRWTVREIYTSEPHQGSLIHEMYLVMGHVGRYLRVPWGRASDIYHVARVVLAIALLVMILEFCKRTIGIAAASVSSRTKGVAMWTLVGFLFAVTASSWPKLVYVEGIARFGGYMAWWSVVDSLQRITFIPHLLAGQALMIVLIIALSRSDLIKRPVSLVFLGLLGFVLGMIFPPGLIFVYTVMGLIVGLHVMMDTRNIKKILVTWMVPYIGFVAITAPSVAYLLLMTSMYPWKRLAEFDTLHPLPFNYIEYIQALGPMLPLGLVGLVLAYVAKVRPLIPAVAWVLGWMVLLFVFKFIPAQSPLRFSEMLPNIPLGVLSAYLAYVLWYKIKNLRVITLFLEEALIVIGMFHMYSSWLWQKDFVDHKIRAGLPLVPTGSYVMYPLKEFMQAIGYIQDSAKRDEIVLSGTTAGNYIPVHSGNTVYIGHDNTVKAEEKKLLAYQFYSGAMSVTQAQEWLSKERISIVFFGPQEHDEGGLSDLSKSYPFLEKVYNNSMFVVFRIR